MSEYVGKTCPYCKTAFLEGEEIVVCSTCEMPHHKECWIENQGCTTFGCMGTIDTISSSKCTSTSQSCDEYEENSLGEAVLYCAQCGNPNPRAAAFCAHCGNRIVIAQAPISNDSVSSNKVNYPYVAQQEDEYRQVSKYQGNGNNPQHMPDIDVDVQRLVGENAEYYIPKFRYMTYSASLSTWNWLAFLVPSYWMFYRKMYGLGFALSIVEILISLINLPAIWVISLGIYIALGIFGNGVYMKHLESRVYQMKAMDRYSKEQFIAANGGVNSTITACAVVIRVILACIIFI